MSLIFIRCRPFDFIVCDDPVDLEGNSTLKEVEGYGCLKVCHVYFPFLCHKERNETNT